jgi:anti-sigma regulatory factor (Ser/Thr protein kinase)
MRNHLSLLMSDDTQVGEARRLAVRLATENGFDETDTGRVAVVATELARNLVKHAKHGEMLLCTLDRPGHEGLELISIDQGPGMADVEFCMRDGYSSAGTPGNGLGAIRRMTEMMDVYSVPGQGTAILVRLFRKDRKQQGHGRFDIGAVNVPVKGEVECGDAWLVAERGDRALAMIADGLGHGPDAAKAAEAALNVMKESGEIGLCDLLDEMHAALKSTRGAAVSIAELRPGAAQVRYAGIGNVSGLVYATGTSRSMVSHNGTLGHTIRSCQEFSYPWSRQSMLVMHSDGISSQWDLKKYPGILMRDPSLIAAVIYRDYKRGRDDATVVVAREKHKELVIE